MKKKGWKDIPIGGLIDKPGTAKEYNNGDWRTFKPVVDKEKCINCLQCWIYCPDSSIIVKEGKMECFDYGHCKGCGRCVSMCPQQAITMTFESGVDTVTITLERYERRTNVGPLSKGPHPQGE